jgi:hypothetical protein
VAISTVVTVEFNTPPGSSETTPLLVMNSLKEDGPTKETAINDSSSEHHASSGLYVEDAQPRKAPWWSYIWDYEPGRSEEERVFIQKLDIFLITMLSFGYFIKNLDSGNVANAFVSGMKEDLAMNGNQINLVDTAVCNFQDYLIILAAYTWVVLQQRLAVGEPLCRRDTSKTFFLIFP